MTKGNVFYPLLGTKGSGSLYQAETGGTNFLTRPLQFLPDKDKDEEWYARNIDWLEYYGYRQLYVRSRKFMKNYKLVAGILDKEDYVPSQDNEYSEILEFISEDNNDFDVASLKFYPIVPRVINTLVTEFIKRKTEVLYRAIDAFSVNEILKVKKDMVKQMATEYMSTIVMAELAKQGLLEGADPAQLEQAKQKMKQEIEKQFPELQEFFDKSYVLEVEELSKKIHDIDVNRFKMTEKEAQAIVDFFTTSEEFWHFEMLDGDYNIELWSPLFTFYRKNPNSMYISEGDFVGKIELMTVQQVIDKYGKYMKPDVMSKLEEYYGMITNAYAGTGRQNDGSYWDDRPGADNSIKSGGVDYRRVMYWFEQFGNLEDIVTKLFNESEDSAGGLNWGYLRVTTVYWKTQKKVGFLTKIDKNGNKTKAVVTEDYKITEKPVYNTALINEKSADTLVFGEHIDWTWINEVVGGIKIGPNFISYFGQQAHGLFPIYIGINSKKPGPLKFQFKNSFDDIYGCKLPVEGIVFTERNTRVSSLVDLMKPFQIAYNLVNNQIMDILMDEIGTVVMIDQNVLPKHSLGEDWGNNPYLNALIAMKQFKMLPVDTSAANMENPINFNHFQALNLEHSARLQSRIQLAEYFKAQCLEAIGFNIQRLMGASGQYQSARSIEQSIVQSYNVTERYFVTHCDFLMPRVHEMRTNLFQYYAAYSENFPKVMVNVLNSGERQIMKLDPKDIAIRDLAIYVTNDINYRSLIDQLKMIVMSNPNTGASLVDIANILDAKSYNKLKETFEKLEERKQQQAMQELEAKKQELLAIAQLNQKDKEIAYNYNLAVEELKSRYRLLEAQIKSAGYGATQDINLNRISDYEDFIKKLKEEEEYKRLYEQSQQHLNYLKSFQNDKLQIQREKNDTEIIKTAMNQASNPNNQ